MKPTPHDEFSEPSEDADYTRQVVLMLCGLAGILWLMIGPNHPIGRTIAGLLSVTAVAILTWLHCRTLRRAHQKNTQLTTKIAEQSEQSAQTMEALQIEFDTLDYYLHTLMEHIPANIYFKDEKSRFLRVNRRMAESLGTSEPDDLLGKTDHDFFKAKHADQALADETRILKTGEAIEDKIENETFANGRSGWVLTAKMPFRDRSGTLIGTFGLSTNITELVETRDTLERERNMLRSLIDSFPDPIFVRDLDRHYLVVNKAMAKWLGLKKPEKMLGKKPEDYFPDELVCVGAKEDAELLATGEPVLNRLWKSRNYQNELRYVSTTKVPWIDDQGRTLGIVGMDRDVTESNRARAQLEQTEKQLIQAEKMESVGRLASGVAHEVKNPLAMIGMGLELLARRIPEDDQAGREALERMERGIERAKTIVKGLVDFSSNRQIKRHDVDPNQLIRETITLVDYQLRKANIKVVESFGENLPPIQADVTKLEQVLINLVINAMHAMEDGGTLTLSTRCRTLTHVDRDEGLRQSEHLREGDRVICIQVRDTGGGIDPEHLAKLYDPFFTTKPTGVGTGLGLSVSRKIIELHRGTLQIENHPDGGVCATITLSVPKG